MILLPTIGFSGTPDIMVWSKRITAGGRYDHRLEFEGHIIKLYRSLVPRIALLIPQMDSAPQS